MSIQRSSPAIHPFHKPPPELLQPSPPLEPRHFRRHRRRLRHSRRGVQGLFRHEQQESISLNNDENGS
ncbi:hypothetical protein HanIR_Chr11g0515241 [Helianthus annuus]|nr:hypothetical protein HanIR_Chr11g0515241 [Helianthus annuus]